MDNEHKLAELELYLRDEDAVTDLAQQFAQWIVPSIPISGKTAQDTTTSPGSGARIYLKGDLGAGKTTFARALLRACGVTGRIKSPSYALLESYNVSNLYFYHLDFYRFSDSQDWIDAGFRDILHEEAVILVEWPEQAGALLPPPDIEIRFSYAPTGRNATVIAYSNKGQLWLSSIKPPLAASRDTQPPGGDY